MLFAGGGCTPDEPIDDLEKATISVSPTEHAFTLAGGEVTFEVTSNSAWEVEADAEITIAPTSGNGNGSVTITVPETTAARNIFVTITASRTGSIGGVPYPTTDKVDVVLFQNENGEAKFVTNVKAVRAALKEGSIPSASKADDAAAVSAEVAAMTLTAVVVGEPNGNLSSNSLLAVQDNGTEPESGLTLFCDNAKGLVKGQVVTVSLADAKVGAYGGVIQLYTAAVTAVGKPIEVTPIVVTLKNILDYESQYVKVENLHPAPSAVGKSFAEAASNKNISFFDANYDEVVVRVNNYAPFKDDIIPAKEGTVCGISSAYNSTIQLLPQYITDFELTKDFVFDAQTVTIAEIVKPGLYKVENAWVVGFTGNGVILTDASGAFVNTYIKDNAHKTIGEKMTIEGVANNHQGGYQFDSPKITKVEGTAEVTYPEPENYTEASAVEELVANYGSENAPYLAKYVELSGIVNVSGGYYNLIIADVDQNVIKGSLSKTPNEALKLDDFNGKAVKLRGFVTDYNTPYLSITATSVEIDSSLVSLSAENVAIVAAAGIENGVSAISSNGLKNEDITVTPDGTVVTAAQVDVETQTLTYTVSANTGAAREGAVTLSVSGMNDVVITFSQLGSDTTVSTIAEVWAGAIGNEYVVIGAQAVAVANNQVILADNSGELIALYKPSMTPVVGDLVNVQGNSGSYNGLIQLSNATVSITGHNDTLITSQLKSLTGATADELVAAINAGTDYAPYYVEYIGILSVSGSYYNVEIPNAATAIGSLKASSSISDDIIKSYANKPIKVKGYFYGVSSKKYVNTSVESIENDTTIKMLKANDITGVSADGVTDATATIVAANLGEITATPDGTVVTSASVADGVLTYTVSANTTTDAREGSIILSAEGVESVTITVSQVKGLDLNATSYTLTLDDIKSISYSSNWASWNTTAADGSTWSGYAYKNTDYYQFSFDKSHGANEKSGLAHLLTPSVPEGKKIVRITFNSDGKTSNNRYLVALPADFAYTGANPSDSEIEAAAYAKSAATVKDSTEPIVIDLSGKNVTGAVQIRVIGGAAYVTGVKIDFE